MASKFIDVLHTKPGDDFEIRTSKIVETMELMAMRKRDKGSIHQTQKYNTLRGRWFANSKKEKTMTVKTDIEIKRGAIIRVSTLPDAPYYVVYVVWKDSGSKWFPTVGGEYLLWLIKSSEKKHF